MWDSAPGSAAKRVLRPTVQKSPAPELEGDERPKLEVEIPSLFVPLRHLLDVRGVKDAASSARLRQQQLPDKVAQLSSEPVPERDPEAVLGPVNDLVSQDFPHGSLEDVLHRPVAQPELRGNHGGELDQFVIEQWDAHLNGMRHAHPVHFGQDVEWEGSLQVQGLEPGAPVAVSAPASGQGRTPP